MTEPTEPKEPVKTRTSEQIEADIQRFLEAGGKIYRAKYGESRYAEPTKGVVTPTSRSKKRPESF